MAVNVQSELDRHGLSYHDFCGAIRDVFVALYPEWTDEEMLYHRHETDAFIRAVQMRIRADIEDHLILRTLVNLRKSQRKP